jgi:hypothetical protein
MTQRHLDIGSRFVILITFALFVAALFIKGMGHELLLEAGVFLVSVKLILMAYKTSVNAKELNDRLDKVQSTLTRVETTLQSRSLAELRVESPAGTPAPSEAAQRPEEAKRGTPALG